MPAYDIVCLGGGNSSGYLAKDLVAAATGQSLCIITDEEVVAYERPALSKGYLAGAAKLPGFHTCVGGGGERQDPEWYKAKGVSYLTASKVTSADLAAKVLTLASGETITYGKLVIATGARATTLEDFKTPGGDLKGVHYLRNVADAASLLEAMGSVKAAGGKAVLIGGGYIGMEVAAGMANAGVTTSMVFPEPHMMPRLFTPELAAIYESFYTGKGITLVKGGKVVSVEGGKDGAVTGVVVSFADDTTKTLPADLVVVGIGARANTELFTSQLEMALGGIKVDSHLCTSVPGVYAIGDVATFPLKTAGGDLARQEHVVCCRQMAAHVAKELTSSDALEFDYLPNFYSRVFHFAWQFYGFSEGAKAVHFGDLKSDGKFGAYWVKDGKVVGAFLEAGTPEENAQLKRVALERPSAPEDLASLGLEFASKL